MSENISEDVRDVILTLRMADNANSWVLQDPFSMRDFNLPDPLIPEESGTESATSQLVREALKVTIICMIILEIC